MSTATTTRRAPSTDDPSAEAQAGRSPISRPLWMLAPPGVLIGIVIGIPLVLAVIISLLDLDQYSLRSWYSAPFIGLGN